jgi:integrase/recombinase XerD
MKTEWHDRMIKALQLNGKGERTQQAYARALRMLVDFYNKSPDLISEEEFQDYFLHRKHVNHWSPAT